MNLASIVTFFTQSSEDPNKTSATLTGILISVASYAQQYLAFVPGVNHFFASPIGQQIDPVLTCVGFILGSAWTLFGLLRKLTNKADTLAQPTPTV